MPEAFTMGAGEGIAELDFGDRGKSHVDYAMLWKCLNAVFPDNSEPSVEELKKWKEDVNAVMADFALPTDLPISVIMRLMNYLSELVVGIKKKDVSANGTSASHSPASSTASIS